MGDAQAGSQGSDAILLSIETTCDETGAAVLAAPLHRPDAVPRVLSNVVASQFDLHARFGGVVPEIAARAHLSQILPIIDEALRQAGVPLAAIDAVAVATRPGLVGSLLVGLSAAKSLAMARGVPLIAFDHLEGHLYACQLAYPASTVYPCVGLVISGGHTHLYRCQGPLDAQFLGGTIDDAAGEAFDKVAALLKLGFPGGPALEKTARDGNPAAHAFPRAFLNDSRLAFSFSGLKTAVLYTLRGQGSRPPVDMASAQEVADVAASFQQAVADVVVVKCRQALKQTGLRRLCVAGGVAANQVLRQSLEQASRRHAFELVIPPTALCTDNAALGAIAYAKWNQGLVDPLDIDVEAGLRRAPASPKPRTEAG